MGIDYSQKGKLYVYGERAVWLSQDNGLSWKSIFRIDEKNSYIKHQTQHLVDLKVTNTGVIFVSSNHKWGSRANCWKSEDQGVTWTNLENTKTWVGKVVRINGKVDNATQTIKAFIEVKDEDLKEGQYLEVALNAKSEENVFEVSRKLLVDNSKIYVVNDTILDLIPVNTVFENKNSVIIKGLKNGTKILSKPVPGAHAGMLVKVFNKNDQ